MLAHQGQQHIHRKAICTVCQDCKHATLFAHTNTFVYLSVPELSVLAGLQLLDCVCSSKPCSQTTLSPGNTSKVHRGQTRRKRKRKQKEEERASSTLPFFFLPFDFDSKRYRQMLTLFFFFFKPTVRRRFAAARRRRPVARQKYTSLHTDRAAAFPQSELASPSATCANVKCVFILEPLHRRAAITH